MLSFDDLEYTITHKDRTILFDANSLTNKLPTYGINLGDYKIIEYDFSSCHPEHLKNLKYHVYKYIENSYIMIQTLEIRLHHEKYNLRDEYRLIDVSQSKKQYEEYEEDHPFYNEDLNNFMAEIPQDYGNKTKIALRDGE